MARYLKRGMDAGAIKAADAKVRETVETILAAIETRRDATRRCASCRNNSTTGRRRIFA
jgi:sulfopropanediol 3-dehydrogenase